MPAGELAMDTPSRASHPRGREPLYGGHFTIRTVPTSGLPAHPPCTFSAYKAVAVVVAMTTKTS